MVSVLLSFVVAIFLGALVGLQREYNQQRVNLKKFAGFRTFILISFFGALLGYFSESFNSVLVIVGFIGILVFSSMAYLFGYLKYKFTSATTEISAVLVYLIGVLCTVGSVRVAIVFGILLVSVLAFRENLHDIARKINKVELLGVVKFSIISLVILPFLPNKNYSLTDIPGFSEILSGLGFNVGLLSQVDVFNFYHIWLMVILVAGISFFGYFLVKIFHSKRGFGLLGFLGGIVSSTAVTLSMAGESKKGSKNISPYILATLIATSVMFVRVLFEVAVLNSSLIPTLILPITAMFLVGLIVSFVFSKKSSKKSKSKEVEFKQPFAIVPALKFGLFFLFILFVSKIAQLSFGSLGIYATSLLSGLADVDAITLSMSNLSRAGGISNAVASMAILLALFSNMFVKSCMAWFFGSKRFGKFVFGAFVLIVLCGIGVLLLL